MYFNFTWFIYYSPGFEVVNGMERSNTTMYWVFSLFVWYLFSLSLSLSLSSIHHLPSIYIWTHICIYVYWLGTMSCLLRIYLMWSWWKLHLYFFYYDKNLEALSLPVASHWPAFSRGRFGKTPLPQLLSGLALEPRLALELGVVSLRADYHSWCSYKGWSGKSTSVLSRAYFQVKFSLDSCFRFERWFWSQLIFRTEMSWWILKPFSPDNSYFCQCSHWWNLERCLFKDLPIQRT